MKIQNRTVKGSKIRSTLITPGVLYGKGMDSAPVQADALEFMRVYHSKGTSKTFEVTLGKKKHIVYIKAVQELYDLPGVKSHFDLVKVTKDDTMTSKVRLEFTNHKIVEKSGLIVNAVTDTIEIEYAVGSGISSLKLDVGELTENDTLKVSDIVAPEGVTILDNMEDTVVTISRQKEEVVEEDEDSQVITEVESIKQKDE